ncbi:branched-chain amino acid ABC transporter permease [Aestuariivirga sp.]|uniref:branched-chain amino acid ABC transporter permease n=1 Tax=Aestuariivirga sp. TaxID=2650926 RepID=UPI003BA94E77
MSLAEKVPAGEAWLEMAARRVGGAHALLAAALIVYPLVVPPFFAFQIGGQILILGMVALSLMVLAGLGGMVSLAQLTVAGIAGYMVAIFGVNSVGIMGLGWPWWLTVPVAVLIAALSSALIGLISVRTSGIYTIMITLAIATAFYYFTNQNYALFNGFAGFRGIAPPTLFGLYWRDPLPFYYLCLGIAALSYAAVLYGQKTPFGLSLQAVRDNQRRMRAIGYDVTAVKVMAYFLAGLIAGVAGVLYVWFNGRISPGTISVAESIGILVIAVIGGLRHPIGPFLGAALYVVMKTFAIDVIGAERFNTLIGLVFLVIVFVSPDGILGLWERLKPHLAPKSLRSPLNQRGRE